MRQISFDPDQLAVVRVAGDVRIAEGDVNGILGDGGRVDGQVRLFVGALVHAEAEVVSPKFLAVLSIKAERQQGFLVFQVGSDEHPVAVHDGRTGSPARQLHRPPDVLGLAPADGEVPAVRHAICVWPSPTRPVGRRSFRLPRGSRDGFQKKEGCDDTEIDSLHERPALRGGSA